MNKQYYQSRTGFITQSALIAALYVVLTMIVAPIAFGPIQFRVSEVLCVLPYFLTSAVPGVTIGCFLANLLCLERRINGWYVFHLSFPTPLLFHGYCAMHMVLQT